MRLAKQCPEAKVLFMSGYPDNGVVSIGSLGPGTTFIQKPFATGGLMRKVREVLVSFQHRITG